ncbi:MAG: hypothetical protein R2681_17955 [Pyrinomonadaceae bacterium]
MVKKNDKKYRYKQRLQVDDENFSSAFITALVENTKRSDCGKKVKPDIRLSVESVYSYVSMDFEIEFPDQQEEAIRKVREFEAILRKFRKAIQKEAKLQNKRAVKILKAKKIKAR